MLSKCVHGYPKCEFTGKCLCKDLDYWKTYSSGVGRGRTVSFESSEGIHPRERRLFDVNNASNFGISKGFKTKELVTEAYIATSKLYLPNHVYQEWFGPNGHMLDQVSMSEASTSMNVPQPPRVRREVQQDYVLPPPVQLPTPRIPPPVQPPPSKVVNFSQIPSPQVTSSKVNTSQASGVRRVPPTLKSAKPMPIGIVLLGDSTFKEENVMDIISNSTLVMSPDSEHIMPTTRVLNLCSSDNPMKVEQIMFHEATVINWAKFRPSITILQMGTYDLVTGALGQYPPQRTYWKAIRKFCLQMPEMAMSCMDAASREAFQKLMEVHQFIVLPPLDLLEYVHRPGVIPSDVYESVRGSAHR